MTSPDMGPGGSWEAPDGSRPWNTGDSSPDGLAFMAAADEEHWRETAFRAPFRQSYNPIGVWSNGISGIFTAIIGGLFNGWFGGGSVGDPLEVQYTIEAIKDAIINGYNVETKVQSGTWTKPANLTELIVICVGCGQNGANGVTDTATRAAGGLGGGYVAQQVPVEDLPSSISYTVGTSNGASSTFGSYASTTPGQGGISSSFGFTPTTSLPGNGGGGGLGNRSGVDSTAGLAGQSTPLAAGGAGGARGTGANNGSPGSAGGNANPASVTKCGGAGGGGGGGAQTSFVIPFSGGPGGPGGYPGGGGGGGGGSSLNGGSNGAGGIGATGIIWIFWR
ncbi:hypothetical protein [Gordonia rubripertincta]|uniref:glycine-rich domain-containing protein n=1 Tax=Gordonia rubripertincta TaxID=36822 RepID=UPI0015F80379|nr:hypothetical protein [Gordonia rubripertincta]QMU19365.1 hypothetical protein H3V45_14830 [Gordonia rubripertincta]